MLALDVHPLAFEDGRLLKLSLANEQCCRQCLPIMSLHSQASMVCALADEGKGQKEKGEKQDGQIMSLKKRN